LFEEKWALKRMEGVGHQRGQKTNEKAEKDQPEKKELMLKGKRKTQQH